MQPPSALATAVDFVSSMFGPFDRRLDFQTIQFTAERHPFTAYPLPYSQFRVQICLPASAADEEWKVARHLSHELVHCLSPNGLPSLRATVLEEGLAEHCSIHFMRANYTITGSDFEWADSVQGSHRVAFDLVEQVVEHEDLGGMRAAVRSVRAATGLPFADLSADALAAHFTKTPPHLLDRLSGRFADLN
ncbi:MAG: hypothetical protein E7812_09045 [Phenylobacterium sp.]|nr:MAG: hypothetical protein E7812_09045 [Phenylobacterium sp.]